MLVRRPAVQAAAAITRYARPLSTLGTPRENWAQVCSCQFEPAPSRLLCCCLNCRHGWLSHAEPPSPHASQFGYETRCAAVVQVSDFAARRLKPISLPIVLGSTFELDDCAHGARLHAKREQPYADGDGYVYGRWGSPTNEGAARQLAALEGIGPADEGGCMIFSSGAPPPPPALTLSRSRTGPCPSSPHQRSVGLLLRRHGGHLGRAHGHAQGGRPRGHALCAAPVHSGRPAPRPPRSAHAGPHLACIWPPAQGACSGRLTRLPAPARVAVAVYGGTNEFMSQFMTQWGVEWTLVDATDPNEFVKAIRPNTKVTSGPASSRARVACAGADRAHARVGSHPAPCHPLPLPSVPTRAPLTTPHHASPRLTTPHHPAPPRTTPHHPSPRSCTPSRPPTPRAA